MGKPVRPAANWRALPARRGRAAWRYTLDEPRQEVVAARLRLGYPAGGTTYCVAARADLVLRGQGRDGAGRFRGRGIVGEAERCPPAP